MKNYRLAVLNYGQIDHTIQPGEYRVTRDLPNNRRYHPRNQNELKTDYPLSRQRLPRK